jgi:hypothetical protein
VKTWLQAFLLSQTSTCTATARDAEFDGATPTNLAPSLVWAEITSFIKGSADALCDYAVSGGEVLINRSTHQMKPFYP